MHSDLEPGLGVFEYALESTVRYATYWFYAGLFWHSRKYF